MSAQLSCCIAALARCLEYRSCYMPAVSQGSGVCCMHVSIVNMIHVHKPRLWSGIVHLANMLLRAHSTCLPAVYISQDDHARLLGVFAHRAVGAVALRAGSSIPQFDTCHYRLLVLLLCNLLGAVVHGLKGLLATGCDRSGSPCVVATGYGTFL